MEHGLFGFLFIAVALIFIFGGRKKLEDLGAGFGGFMREFNKARQDAATAPAAAAKAEPKPKKRKAPAKQAAPRKKR